MCSAFCLILAAIAFVIAVLVFAALILWCDSFQLAGQGGATATAPPRDNKDDDDQADTDAAPAAENEGDGLPEIDTATPEQAAAAFREELDGGFARQDEALGVIYNQRPDSVDDLKLIKGVANILEQKLHDSGIHRFKQIALWTDQAAREFGTRLSFSDRIFRDDWVAQAKQYHEDKYDEKL